MLGAEHDGASPSPLTAVGARGCLGCWWLLEDGGLLEDPVLVPEPLWSCSCLGTGSTAVVKPADHVQKGAARFSGEAHPSVRGGRHPPLSWWWMGHPGDTEPCKQEEVRHWLVGL